MRGTKKGDKKRRTDKRDMEEGQRRKMVSEQEGEVDNSKLSLMRKEVSKRRSAK